MKNMMLLKSTSQHPLTEVSRLLVWFDTLVLGEKSRRNLQKSVEAHPRESKFEVRNSLADRTELLIKNSMLTEYNQRHNNLKDIKSRNIFYQTNKRKELANTLKIGKNFNMSVCNFY